ncbi:hypothetical protein ACJVC5_19955 [Peredibacter sp. HCB2-198]|uniref:hypothetical protein n=1 Tax=Peredibacter sp. HCB2-198 TaxID=3383025 RepID=UPI0038B50463
MRILIWFLFVFSSVEMAFAAPTDICDIIKIPNCPGVTKQMRRTTFPTAPTPATAAVLNPSNVSFDRGAGLEAIAQAKNPVFFSIASGTGKMGGALISGSLDNSFFGNRVPELNEDIVERSANDHQFKPKKFSFALGGKLIGNRKAGLDFGVIVKRHSEIKDINPGAGISGRYGMFHIGASVYQDDSWIDLTKYSYYTTSYGKDSLADKFTVKTFTGGFRFHNLAVDVGSITSNPEFFAEETKIMLYSAAYHFKNVLLNVAYRKEHSSAPVYKKGELEFEQDKSAFFASGQYSFGQHLIMGVNYNYFLLDEVSLSATLFI